MATLFELRGVVVRRGGRHVLGPIDLDLPGDGPVVIVGPSGSGKSSLLRLLNRLDEPSAGTIRYRGDDLRSLDPQALRRRVAMVFQRPTALPGSVADNLREADPSLSAGEVATALTKVGLDPELGERPARELSGGEAQRMALARSLATQPEVVLFDEPTSSLDADNAERIEQLACGLAADGIAGIWVTHDDDQRRRIARHVIDLDDVTRKRT